LAQTSSDVAFCNSDLLTLKYSSFDNADRIRSVYSVYS
jgi:hypothetical protein